MSENREEALVPRPKETAALVRAADQISIAPPSSDQDAASLRDSWRIIRKHRWMILTVLVTLVTIVAVYSFKATPIYEAKATLQIDKESPSVVDYKDFVAENKDTELVAIATQVKVLQSQTLANRVISQLNLWHHPLFDPGLSRSGQKGTDVPTQVSSSPTLQVANDPLELKHQSLVVDRFLRALTVKPIRDSRIVEVSVNSPDAELGARIVNALVTNFIDLNMESRYEATLKASDWLLKQSVDLKSRVEKSEQALVDYARSNGIVNLDDKQNVVTQRLSDLNRDLTLAQSDRIAKESLYQQVHSNTGSDINLIKENTLINVLSERQAELQSRYAEMVAKFKPDWPAAVQLKTQLDDVTSQIEAEKQRLIKGINADYFTAIKREQLLQHAVEQEKVEANALSEKSIQYNILKREVETNKQLYEGLLQRLKEAGVSAGLKSSNIRVVDFASIPLEPVSPKKASNILMSVVIGLLLGLSLAFAREYFDTSLKTPDESERLLRVPTLAMVPSLAVGRSRKLLSGRNAAPSIVAKGNGDSPGERHVVDLISHTNVKSVLSEAYRSLRTSVLLSTHSSPPKKILVTSSGPGEGKTTTAVNLGIALGQMGCRVLIVDADMRRPRVHKIFGVPPSDLGLSAYLSGNSKLVPLIKETDVPNLFIIPAGYTPPNPSELIGSGTMRDCLDLLASHFDHVILDSPPIMSVTDPTILSTLVDGVVLVILGGITNRNAAARAAQRLRDVGARVFGTVLNNVNVKSADYDYYYHQYYYYSYYSDEKAKKSQM